MIADTLPIIYETIDNTQRNRGEERGNDPPTQAFDLSFAKGAVNQRQPAPPEGPNLHVGGEMFSANKLAVLSPYLALFSVIAVAAVVVKRKLT